MGAIIGAATTITYCLVVCLLPTRVHRDKP